MTIFSLKFFGGCPPVVSTKNIYLIQYIKSAEAKLSASDKDRVGGIILDGGVGIYRNVLINNYILLA